MTIPPCVAGFCVTLDKNKRIFNIETFFFRFLTIWTILFNMCCVYWDISAIKVVIIFFRLTFLPKSLNYDWKYTKRRNCKRVYQLREGKQGIADSHEAVYKASLTESSLLDMFRHSLLKDLLFKKIYSKHSYRFKGLDATEDSYDFSPVFLNGEHRIPLYLHQSDYLIAV